MSMGVALAAHPFSATVRRTLAMRTMRTHGLALVATAAATAVVLWSGTHAAALTPSLCQPGTPAPIGWMRMGSTWLAATLSAAVVGVFPLLFIARMHAKAHPATPAVSPKPSAALAALLRSPVLAQAHPHSPLVALLAVLLETSTWVSAVLHALCAAGFAVPVLFAIWRLTPFQAPPGADPTCAALTSYSPWAWRLPAPPALSPRKLLVQPWPLPGARALDMRPNELVIVALVSSLVIGATLSIVADITPALQAWDLSRTPRESAPRAAATNPALPPPTGSWIFTAPALRVHAVAPLSLEQSILYSLLPSQAQTPLLQWRSTQARTWYGPAAWATLAGLSLPAVLVITLAFSVVGLGFYPFLRRYLWASIFSVVGPSVVPSFRRPLWTGAYFAPSLAYLGTSWSSPGITLLLLHLAFALSWTTARVLWFVYISQPLHSSNASRKPGLQPTLQSLENEYAPFALATLASAVGTMPAERSAIYKHVPATGTAGTSSWSIALKGSLRELTLFDQRLACLLAPPKPAPAAASPAPAPTGKAAPKPVEAASSSVWDRLASDTVAPRQRLFATAAAEPPKSYAVPRLPAPSGGSGSGTPWAQAGLTTAKTHVAHYALLSGAYAARGLRTAHALLDTHLLPRAPVQVQHFWRSTTECVADRTSAALRRSDVLVDRALVGPAGTRGGSAAAAVWAAQILCALVVHSLEEDPYGTVQRDVPAVVSALTAAVEAAGPCTPSPGGTDVESDWAVVHTVLRASLSEVRDTFAPFAKDLNWGPLDPGGVRAWERMERALKKATEGL